MPNITIDNQDYDLDSLPLCQTSCRLQIYCG